MNIDRRTLLASAAATIALGAVPRLARAAAAVDGPPVPKVEPVTETLWGVKVTDPYRWMENPKDPDWAPYMKAQADYAEEVLSKIPGREAMREQVSKLSGDLEVLNSVAVAGPYMFMQIRPVGANSYKLFVSENGGPRRLLVDPETRNKDKVHYALSYWTASPNGKYVAYGISPGGSEDAVAEIMEVASGKVLPERIDRAQLASPTWANDSSGFFINRLAEDAKKGTATYYQKSICWFHKLNTDPKNDIRVWGSGVVDGITVEDIDFPIVLTQPGSDYAIGLLETGVQNELTLYVGREQDAKKGKAKWTKICSPDAKVTGLTLRGDDIYLLTYEGAPRYKVVHVKAQSPAASGATEVVPESKNVITNLAAAKDAIYIQSLDAGIGRVSKLGADGKVTPIDLPFDGAVSAGFADPRLEGAWFQLEGWVKPAELLRLDPSGMVTDTGLVTKPSVDASPYDSIETFAVAKDGVKVPMSVVFRKDTKKDGKAPSYVWAYGAYGVTQDPGFLARYFAYLDQGGVFALAHVRGGGEEGHEWYIAGKGPTKPNTWNDLIACCEGLIKDGWTAKKKIAIAGGSAGGITVGRALTERPDLFGSVIDEVGCSNALRMEFSQNGPDNVPEFGSVKTEQGFKDLYAMDSYQHVKDGVKYPAVLLTTGMNDPRVAPWQAGKMAARLQKATGSGKPVILRIEYDAGHGIGSTRKQSDDEHADCFVFALWQAGVKAFQPKT